MVMARGKEGAQTVGRGERMGTAIIVSTIKIRIKMSINNKNKLRKN